MTPTAPTAPTVPNPPAGVPAWLVHIVAALVGIAGPVVAWVDPNQDIPPGGVQAAIILVFLLVGAAIFLAHLILAATHEYGWTMQAAEHIGTEADAEFRQLWPEIKQSYTDAKPALDQVKAVQPTIDALSADVSMLKQRTDAAGLNPEAVVKALETVTGVTYPRVASSTAQPAPTGAPPAPAAGR